MSVLCEEGLERFWTDAKTYLTGTAVPLMDGTATVGSSSKFAREDHVHPSDTTKQDKLVAGSNITIAADGKTISADNTTYTISKSGSTVTLTGSDGSTSTFTDADTTYTTMTAAQMSAGTDTTGRLVTAKDLHDTYVNVTGDTMTGSLVMQDRSVFTKDTAITYNVTPSADIDGEGYYFHDKNSVYLGGTRIRKFSNGDIGTELFSTWGNSGTIYNLLSLHIKSDGTNSVYVSDPAAWRTALGVYSTTESDNRYVNVTGDTMTGTLTISAVNGYRVSTKATNVNMKATNNGTTSNIWHGMMNYDNNDYQMGGFLSQINTNGQMGVGMWVYNRNTAGSQVGASNFAIMMDKSANVTYSIAHPGALRTALSLNSQIIARRYSATVVRTAGNYASVTATAISGYTFLCWVGTSTSGWVGVLYPVVFTDATTNFWVASSSVPSSASGTFYANALYIRTA